MNKVILMGRLTRDPEINYSQNGNNTCIAKYTLAVDRSLSRMAGRRLISSPVRYSEKERSLPRNISTKEPRLQLQADLKLVPIRIRTA